MSSVGGGKVVVLLKGIRDKWLEEQETFFGLAIWIKRLGGRHLKANAVVDERISLCVILCDSCSRPHSVKYHLQFCCVSRLVSVVKLCPRSLFTLIFFFASFFTLRQITQRHIQANIHGLGSSISQH